MRQLSLDCDGVLADFDKGATQILGLPPRAFEKRHGPGRFRQEPAAAPDCYFGLPPPPDAGRWGHIRMCPLFRAGALRAPRRRPTRADGTHRADGDTYVCVPFSA